MDTLRILLPKIGLIVWLIGGAVALCYVARKEQKRLGGRFFSHLMHDIEELPFPATLGYICLFAGSWVSFIYHRWFDPLLSDEHGNPIGKA